MAASVPGVPLPPLGDHELLVFWCQLLLLLLTARVGAISSGSPASSA